MSKNVDILMGYTPAVVAEALESITATLPGTVYHAADGSALFLHEDGLYIIRVAADGTTSSAYTAQQPVEDLIMAHEDHTAGDYTPEDLPELEGWEPGWNC